MMRVDPIRPRTGKQIVIAACQKRTLAASSHDLRNARVILFAGNL